jgi:hypothetical protein
MILVGAKLIASNADAKCPTRDELRPWCRAFSAQPETATGVKPFSAGEPIPAVMPAARKELGLTMDETTRIGDTGKPTSGRRAAGFPHGVCLQAVRGTGGSPATVSGRWS